MEFNAYDTAVVVIDPQNDFLSEKGTSWGLVGASVTKNGIIANYRASFQVGETNDYHVLISPHYFYPTDHAAGRSMDRLKP